MALDSGLSCTPAFKTFLWEHVDYLRSSFSSNRAYCKMMMVDRGVIWKYTNTFIHEPVNTINAVCKDDGIPVGGFNRQSKKTFKITTCTFNILTFSFNGLNGTSKIVLTCLNGLPVRFVRYI
uniref:Ribonuclease A-domain domain-containing protein n=1 Tax=Gopherus evgoodei TaxID=1825980 RepID=A0A8C4Y7D1_9SAUR